MNHEGPRSTQAALRLGVAVGLAMLLSLLAVTLVKQAGDGTSPGNLQALPRPSGQILAGGTDSELSDAIKAFPVPVFRPQHALASDEGIREVSYKLGETPILLALYESDFALKVRPLGLGAIPTEEFAAGQIEQGVKGQIVEVSGVKMFEVPATDSGLGLGSIRFDIDNVAIVIIGNGEMPPETLREVATTVLTTADGVRSEHTP